MSKISVQVTRLRIYLPGFSLLILLGVVDSPGAECDIAWRIVTPAPGVSGGHNSAHCCPPSCPDYQTQPRPPHKPRVSQFCSDKNTRQRAFSPDRIQMLTNVGLSCLIKCLPRHQADRRDGWSVRVLGGLTFYFASSP